jgi:hypothetical protein
VYQSLRVSRSSATVSTILLLTFIVVLARASEACIAITSPVNNTVVSGASVGIGTTDTCSGLWYEELQVDGAPSGAFTPGKVVFDSASVASGSHLITVTSQSINPGSVVLGTASVTLIVQNGAATAATPIATPTPCIKISNPVNNATVSGSSVAINTTDTCTGLWFEALQVDGTPSNAFAPGQIVWNSTTAANGAHQITVTSQSISPGSVVLGTATVTLNAQNGTAGTSSTATPTATATPRTHYSMLAPASTLPSEATCISQVNASPIAENAPWNENDGTGYDSNQPPSGGVPSYFYANVGGTEMTSSAFAAVDGAYAGTTDDIFRVYACKWGIDEDYIRAQAYVETQWHQDCPAAHGGTGCRESGDENNPAGCTTGLPITALSPNGEFCQMEGFAGLTMPNQYASWSIVQNKVFYDWMTWPMMEESTPFAIDYRYAEMRGCVNGDQYTYFDSQSLSGGTDYENAVIAARSNPNGASKISGWTNLQYLGYGCIDTHYSGDWFSGTADSYLNNFLSALSDAPWPGGNK